MSESLGSPTTLTSQETIAAVQYFTFSIFDLGAGPIFRKEVIRQKDKE
jgi:hypothetical protein